MNLNSIFLQLAEMQVPEEGNFVSRSLEGYPGFRVAVSADHLPVLLLHLGSSEGNLTVRNFRLRHLSILHNVNCRVTDERGSRNEQLTVIRFLSREKGLQDFFLRTAEQLISTIGPDAGPDRLLKALDRFAELFRAMSDLPKKTVQGLWSELFLILQSSSIVEMLDYWHEQPEEKYDFNGGNHKVEVKSFSGLERIHFFSAEQLNPQPGDEVVIASVYLRNSKLGPNIFELSEQIIKKLYGHIHLIDKLHQTISFTLGTELQHAHDIRFDYKSAISGLKYFYYTDVPRVILSDLSPAISQVLFRADLSGIKEFKPNGASEGQPLFRALTKGSF